MNPNRSGGSLNWGILVFSGAMVVCALLFFMGVLLVVRNMPGKQVAAPGQVVSHGGTQNMTAVKGQQEFDAVTGLDLSVRNGTVTCTEDAGLETGRVEVAWEYTGKSIDLVHNGSAELRFSDQGGNLKVEDWAEQRRHLGNIDLKLQLTVRHGPGITAVDLNHGNGTYTYEGNAGGTLNLGNGTLNLKGEPGRSMAINLGNGELDADWLLLGDNCQVNLGNGNADLKLREGSGVTFDGTVGIGNVTAPPGVNVRRSHMLGAEFSGSIGDGSSLLDVSLGNGSVDISGA